MTKYRYTNEQILSASDGALSVREIMRRLGIRQSGGSQSHITRRLQKLGFDHRRLLGRRASLGVNRPTFKPPDERLILYKVGSARQPAQVLRRALKLIGIEEQCSECGISNTYNNKPIRLHVDHINGISHDCRPNNLRFLCPNCHSQTNNFSGKNIRSTT